MPSRENIVVLSSSENGATTVRELLASERDLAVQTHTSEGRDLDLLATTFARADLLLIHLETGSMAALEALERLPTAERPPLIVLGRSPSAECMRVAMRAGARDFLTEPTAATDLIVAVRRIIGEQRATKKTKRSQLIAFVNAKGGSGATFIACNTAHLMASTANLKTALVDLDLQCGTLPQYLDIKPRRGIIEALDVASDLDGVAVEAYLTQHESGLSVLAGNRDTAMLHQELMTGNFETILTLLRDHFERVVIDVPRTVEPFSAMALERADQIVLVVQQSVASLLDATRMHDIMVRGLAIPAEHIRVVVNRYQKTASVELADVCQTLDLKHPPICVPNDFRGVTESIDMGIPIYDHARRSPVTKALQQLERALAGETEQAPKGFLPRLLRTG
jgi:pilus assembly protein CpaE